jgi:hypothetical protein
VTFTRPRRPLPRPRSFGRVPRARFNEHVAALEDQRDRAIGRTRAVVEWVTACLEQRADAYVADAKHQERAVRPDKAMPASTFTAEQRRAIADELRQIAIDVDKGPEA